VIGYAPGSQYYFFSFFCLKIRYTDQEWNIISLVICHFIYNECLRIFYAV
jgi:hypothetical protein